MKNLFYLFLLINYFSFTQNINNLPDLIEKSDPSILKVFVVDSDNLPIKQGSAVIISPNGICVSNYHVLAGAKKAIAIDYMGNEYNINKIMDYDENSDLIKFKISSSKNFLYSKISYKNLSKGSSVYAIGFPNGFDINGGSTVSTGIISGTRIIDKIQFIQTTTPITYGSSGGGLFNSGGYLVGVTTGTFAKKVENRHANLNKVVASSYIKRLDKDLNLTMIQFYNKIKNSDIYTQAFIEYDKGNYEKAIDLFYLHLEEFPDDATAWFRLGNCLNQIGRSNINTYKKLLQNAIFCFKTASELAPKYFYPNLQGAIVSIYLEDWDSALSFATNGYNLQPKSQDGNYILGYYYSNIKKYEKAIKYFSNAISYTNKEILKEYNKLSQLYLERAICKSLLYKDFRAESDYKNSLIINSTKQDALANYAYFLINRNKKEKACVLLKKLQNINPNYIFSQNISVSKYYFKFCR